MLQNIDLRSLAEMRGSGRDFLSAYFPASEGLKGLNGRIQALRAMLDDQPVEAEIFEENLQLMQATLEQHETNGAESICFFSCAVLDFALGYPISLDVPRVMHAGPSPYIRPLAELQDEYETFAVVACDNTSTKIFLVTNEAAEVEEAIRGGIKNHVRKGGWSQQRYERRRDNELQQYARAIIESLQTLVESHRINRIVLAGSRETMNEIEREMSPPLKERLVGKETLNLDDGEAKLVERAYGDYFADEREEEKDLWESIKSEYKRHGRAAAGPTEVWEAAQIGRAEIVIVTRDCQIEGRACRECSHVVHGTPRNCQRCGSRSVFQIDLVDAVTRQMELTSGTVNFSDPIPGLAKVGHVAALLRY